MNRKDDAACRDIEAFAQTIKQCHEDAVKLYTPDAERLCRKDATEDEVADFLDGLLSFAADDRILALFRKVCRHYFYKYPQMINDYVMICHEQYEPEKLEKR